jgi:hypothetical protein
MEVDTADLFVFVDSVSARSYAVVSRGTHTYFSFLIYCPRSLTVTGSNAFYLYRHRQCDSSGIFYSSLDPRPGTTVRTAAILGILKIVGRYHYRYNIRPRVVIPLQGSRDRRASSLFLYVHYNFSTSLSAPTSF